MSNKIKFYFSNCFCGFFSSNNVSETSYDNNVINPINNKEQYLEEYLERDSETYLKKDNMIEMNYTQLSNRNVTDKSINNERNSNLS